MGGEYKKCFQNEVSRQLLGVVWQPPSFPNNLFLKIFSFCFLQKFARLQSIFPDISKPGSEQAFLPVTSPGKHSGPVTLPKTETVWVGSLLVFTKPSTYQISVPECCLDKRRMSPTLRWQPSSEVLNLTVGSTLLPATGSWAPLHDHEAWGHHCFSMAVSLVFHAAIWSTSSMLFQSCKSYGEMQVEQGHGKFEHSELVLWQTPKDICPRPHLGYSSLNLSCFIAPVQMSRIWQKLTGQAVSQRERFSK